MLFLRATKEIGGHGDLGLHFLLAVAEVVVGDDRHHHAALVAGADLERLAPVVNLGRVAPAHAVAHLALRGVVAVREAERLLGCGGQVWGEDDQTRVPGPAQRVERRVVLGELGIAGIAEDAFDKVEIGDHRAGHDEPRFHAAFAGMARHADGDQRA